MHFVFTAIALALSAPSVLASPVSPSTELTTIASTFPVQNLEGPFIHPSNITMKKDGTLRSLVARQEFPATLLVCPGANCASCTGFNLATFPLNECFATTLFTSVAISQPSNQGLPFVVGVGPPGCAQFLTIPAVNKCYNINGGTFDDFALFP